MRDAVEGASSDKEKEALALALYKEATGRFPQDVRAAVVPLDPTATDPALSTFFTIHVPDTQDATRLAAVLVEAAYVKPPDEPPVA